MGLDSCCKFFGSDSGVSNGSSFPRNVRATRLAMSTAPPFLSNSGTEESVKESSRTRKRWLLSGFTGLCAAIVKTVLS
jgi:hypothetical protein